MKHPDCDLSVSIVIDKNSDYMQVIKVLRCYLSTSVSLLLKSLKASKPVYVTNLKVSMFYDGWREFYQIINSLREGGFKFTITVNKEEKNDSYADELKDLMMNIKKDDIY